MEDLRDLLRAHQGTVYNICFQVLRSAHDAEDAAQDALLEIARGVATIREPRAFKRWLCRLTLHTALDHLRRRSRRDRHEETRAAMIPSLPDPAADAVHEELSRLDDEDRCLLIEKYFERATLEEIGIREGISAAAVGKRVERAKEKLKRRLAQAGLGVLVASVDGTLEAAPSVSAFPDIVSTSRALEATLSLSTSSGVMSAKSIAGGALVLLLVIGSTYVWRRIQSSRDVSSATTLPTSNGPLQLGEKAVGAVDSSRSVHVESKSSSEELLSRLARFKLWHEERNPDESLRGATFSMEDPDKRLKPIRAELSGVRALILENPRVFLDWIALLEHAPCIRDLMAATLSLVSKGDSESGDDAGEITQDFRDFPSTLTDGLLSLLYTGNEDVRASLLEFALTLSNAPPEWRARYLALIRDESEEIRTQAVQALLYSGKPTRDEIESVIGIVAIAEQEQSSYLLSELCRVSVPEARELVLAGLESGQIPDPRGETVSLVVQWTLMYDPSAGEIFEERVGRQLLSVLPRTGREYSYSQVVFAALHLQPRFARPVVSKAAAKAPTERLRKAAAAVLETARDDEENWRIHSRLWMELMRTK